MSVDVSHPAATREKRPSSAAARGRHRRGGLPGSSRRGAVLTTELLLVLPLLIGLILALFEFSMLWVGNHRVAAAARAGCRVATMQGATPEEVELVVRETLGTAALVAHHSVEIHLGEHPGDRVGVEVRAPMAAAAPDLLGLFGFRLGSKEFVAQCVMRKQ